MLSCTISCPISLLYRYVNVVSCECLHGVMLFIFLCFSDEDTDSPSGGEQFVELDSLDTEKALQLTDEDPL